MTTTATSIPFSPNGDTKPAINFDGWLDTPDEVEAAADESACISAKRIAAAIDALAPVIDDLDHQHKLTMLGSFIERIADIPADDRGEIETALLAILKTKQAADDFLLKIPAPATGPVFTPYSFDDLMAMPEKQEIIKGIMGKRDLGMIFGPPGCGKTFVGISMIVSGCTGGQWAGRFDIPHPLNVAYCAGEGISGLPARFKAATEIYGITRLPGFTFFKTIPQLYTDDDSVTTVTIRQFVSEWKARQEAKQAAALDILFVDTLHTATTAADENSAKDMGKVLHLCRWAANELDCAVVLVHHSNKAGTGERGSSALRGAMDFMIEIKRISETGTKGLMHCAKLKDGEQWKDQTFDLHAVEDCNSVCVLWDEPSDGTQSAGAKSADKATLLAEMTQYVGQRFTVKRLSEAIDKKENYTRNLLGELEKNGLCKRELSKPGKESSRNPWVYFVPAEQSELNGKALGL
jgi:RecA/RadA recombinase